MINSLHQVSYKQQGWQLVVQENIIYLCSLVTSQHCNELRLPSSYYHSLSVHWSQGIAGESDLLAKYPQFAQSIEPNIVGTCTLTQHPLIYTVLSIRVGQYFNIIAILAILGPAISILQIFPHFNNIVCAIYCRISTYIAHHYTPV